MNRRSFFTFLGLAPVVALTARHVSDPICARAFIPLPSGRYVPVNMGEHTIVVQGAGDAETVALIDARIKASNKQMLADLQRNIGSISFRGTQRYGA